MREPEQHSQSARLNFDSFRSYNAESYISVWFNALEIAHSIKRLSYLKLEIQIWFPTEVCFLSGLRLSFKSL